MAEDSIRMRRRRFASFHPLRRTRDEIPDTSSNSSYLTKLSPFVSDTHDPLSGLTVGAVGGTGKMDSVDDACAVCGSGGTLLLCSKCPLAFHFSCVSPPLRTDLNENWACRRCSYPPLDVPVNATTPAPIIEDIKDTPTQSKDTKEERVATTGSKIKTESVVQPEFTSIPSAFAAMADHANAGNPLVFVLPNDIMDVYLQQSQKFDWLRCNNCGKLRRVKDGLVSECLLADWTCSQPYWKTEYGTCARPEDRGCRAVKDAKEYRQVQRQVDFVYEYGPADIPRSRLTFPDKSSSATPERASKRNSMIARVTQLEAENGVVLGEPEFPAEKMSELLEVDMEKVLNKLADVLAKDCPSSQKVMLKPSASANFNSTNFSANNKDMIKMAGMKVNAMPPRSGSGAAPFAAYESNTHASSIAPPATFYGNTQQSQSQLQPKKLTAISVGTSDRYLAANKAAGNNPFAPKLIAPPVVRLTQDESGAKAMGTTGTYTSQSSKIAPPLAAAAAVPGPVPKTGGSVLSPADKLKSGVVAASTSTSEDSAKKARNAVFTAAAAAQQRKNRNSESEAMAAAGKDKWIPGHPQSGGWNPASLAGTGPGMPVHGGMDPNMGMANPHYGPMPHHMRQPQGPPSQPPMGPFGGMNHPMPGQLPVDPKTGMSGNTNMAYPPGGQPPPGGPYPGDPKMDRQFAPNQGQPGQYLGPNQSPPGRGGPGRMPEGYGLGAPPPSSDADGNVAKIGSTGGANGGAGDPSNKRKFIQMQGPEEGYPPGPPRYDYGYFPPEMGPGVGPYGMPPGPGPNPSNRYPVYPPYVDPMTGLPYGDPRAGPYRDPNAPPMYSNMYDPRAMEYGGPPGPPGPSGPPPQGGRRQGPGGSSPNMDDASRQRGRYDDFYFQGANRPGPGMNMPPGAPPGSSGPYAQGPAGIEGAPWPGPINQLPPGMNSMRGSIPGGSPTGSHYMSADGMQPYGAPPGAGPDPEGRPYGQPPSQPPPPMQQGSSQQQFQQQQQEVPPRQASPPHAPSSLIPSAPGTSSGSSVSSKELISKIAQLGFSMEDEDALIELALANNRDLFVLYEAFGATPDRFMRHALTLSKGRRTGAS